ncbi:MAG: metallophosphoesterase family protein [Candidatus Dormiibacterota bacterium]
MRRIGVIADTHCPEFLDRLPEGIGETFAGVELILHAGDVGGVHGGGTLAELERIAPVLAVRGDHDEALEQLPTSREIVIDGRRIALVHGNHGHLYEEPVTFFNTIGLGVVPPLQPGHQRWLRSQFPAADVIISGHTHTAFVDRGPGPMLFNPGPVYVVDPAAALRRLERGPSWFEWSWLQVVRHRRDRPLPSVGILELDGAAMQARVVPLASPD